MACNVKISLFIRKNKVFSSGIVYVGAVYRIEIDAIIYFAAKAALLSETQANHAGKKCKKCQFFHGAKLVILIISFFSKIKKEKIKMKRYNAVGKVYFFLMQSLHFDLF